MRRLFDTHYHLKTIIMNDFYLERTTIQKSKQAISKDLTSGNMPGSGSAYPNALNWRNIDSWATEIWTAATGIDRRFSFTPGTSAMLLFLSTLICKEKNATV